MCKLIAYPLLFYKLLRFMYFLMCNKKYFPAYLKLILFLSQIINLFRNNNRLIICDKKD